MHGQRSKRHALVGTFQARDSPVRLAGAFLAEQQDDCIEGHYLALDVLFRSRVTLVDNQHTEAVKDPVTSPAPTA